MITATTIGKYFMSKNPKLTELQVQKLVYYAYAWYMIKHGGNKLFDEKPEAWKYGPVFRSLYESMRNGKFYEEEQFDELNSDMKNFLHLIYDVYGKYSGNELADMSHSELPWQNASKRVKAKGKKKTNIRGMIGLILYPALKQKPKIMDEDIIKWGNSTN